MEDSYSFGSMPLFFTILAHKNHTHHFSLRLFIPQLDRRMKAFGLAQFGQAVRYQQVDSLMVKCNGMEFGEGLQLRIVR